MDRNTRDKERIHRLSTVVLPNKYKKGSNKVKKENKKVKNKDPDLGEDIDVDLQLTNLPLRYKIIKDKRDGSKSSSSSSSSSSSAKSSKKVKANHNQK